LKDLTILYITDSALDPFLAERCREFLFQAANGYRIVSVSQKPLDFGDNICVGDIGRKAINIDYQIKVGLEMIDTPYVGIAEHDCIYTEEHFNFRPLDPEYFWYNENNWLVQYKNPLRPEYDGMYSIIKGRIVQSQLVCRTDKMKEVTDIKLSILSDPEYQRRYPDRSRVGEPGTNHIKRSERIFYRNNTAELRHLWLTLKDYINNYNAKRWKSKIPNIDIRHGDNFTGQRRGKKRTWNLPPWGEFFSLMNGTNIEKK